MNSFLRKKNLYKTSFVWFLFSKATQFVGSFFLLYYYSYYNLLCFSLKKINIGTASKPICAWSFVWIAREATNKTIRRALSAMRRACSRGNATHNTTMRCSSKFLFRLQLICNFYKNYFILFPNTTTSKKNNFFICFKF